MNSNLLKPVILWASKKGVGSSKNGRDSQPKYLGAKKGDGQIVKPGEIIYRQRGTRVYPGENVGMGVDHTLFAKVAGTVKYGTFGADRKKVSVKTSSVKA